MNATADSAGLSIRTVPVDDPAWQRLLAECEAGPHLAEPWRRYREALGWRAVGLMVETGGRGLGAGLAYLTRSRWRPWIRPEASLDRAPWMKDEAGHDADQVAAALTDLARRERWRRIALHSFDGPSPPAALDGAGWHRIERFEFLWDLTPDEDARLAALKGSHRRKLRKALERGVEVVEAGVDGLTELRDLQELTRSRRAERGETMSRPRDEQYRLMAQVLVAPGAARLFVGRLDGAVVSAVLICRQGSRAYYFLGGTAPAGLRANSASAVMWEAARRLREDGVQVLNLGGVPARAGEEDSQEHGLYRFKDGFGARRVPCASGTWESTEARR